MCALPLRIMDVEMCVNGNMIGCVWKDDSGHVQTKTYEETELMVLEDFTFPFVPPQFDVGETVYQNKMPPPLQIMTLNAQKCKAKCKQVYSPAKIAWYYFNELTHDTFPPFSTPVSMA